MELFRDLYEEKHEVPHIKSVFLWAISNFRVISNIDAIFYRLRGSQIFQFCHIQHISDYSGKKSKSKWWNRLEFHFGEDLVNLLSGITFAVVVISWLQSRWGWILENLLLSKWPGNNQANDDSYPNWGMSASTELSQVNVRVYENVHTIEGYTVHWEGERKGERMETL